MNKENQRGYIAPPKTVATTPQQNEMVNRFNFALPRNVWAVVDLESAKSGLSASSYLSNLILKAARAK